MTLFTRNVAGAFVLTLLNLGATNFAAGEAGGSSGMPPAFARLLGSTAAGQPSEMPQTSPQAGGKVAADALTRSRRDYGSAPGGMPISKTQERRMRELAAVAAEGKAVGIRTGQEGGSSLEMPGSRQGDRDLHIAQVPADRSVAMHLAVI